MLIFDDFLPKAHTLHLCVSVIAQRNNEVLKTRPKLTRVSLSCRASLLPVFRWWSQTDRRRCERCTSGREASTHQGARVELLPTTVVWPSQKTLSQHHSMTSTPLSLRFNTWAPVTSRLTRAHVTKQDVSQHISLQDWAVKKEERHHVLVNSQQRYTERIMGNTHSMALHLQQPHCNTCAQSESRPSSCGDGKRFPLIALDCCLQKWSLHKERTQQCWSLIEELIKGIQCSMQISREKGNQWPVCRSIRTLFTFLRFSEVVIVG